MSRHLIHKGSDIWSTWIHDGFLAGWSHWRIGTSQVRWVLYHVDSSVCQQIITPALEGFVYVQNRNIKHVGSQNWRGDPPTYCRIQSPFCHHHLCTLVQRPRLNGRVCIHKGGCCLCSSEYGATLTCYITSLHMMLIRYPGKTGHSKK